MLELKLMAYGFGHVINDIVTHLYFSYLMIYITGPTVNLNELEGAVVLLCGQTVDALATPILGVLCDHVSSQFPIRNRKRFHFCGVLVYVSSSTFLWAVCLSCETDPALNLVYIIFVVAGVNIGYSATEIAFLSLMPFLHGSEKIRTELVSFAQLNNVLAGIVAYIAFIGITQEYGLYESFGRLFALYVCLSLPGTFVFYRFLTSTPYIDFTADRETNGSGESSIRQWFQRLEFYSVGTAYVAAKMVLNITQVFLPLYTKEMFGEDSPVLGVIPLLQFASSFVATVVAPAVNRRLGRNYSYVFGCCVTLFACIIFAAAGTDTPDVAYLVACLIGFGTMLCLVTSTTMISDICESHAGSASFVYGFFGLVAKIVAGLIMVYVFTVEDLSLLGVLTSVPSVTIILAIVVRMILERPELWLNRKPRPKVCTGWTCGCSCRIDFALMDAPERNSMIKPTTLKSSQDNERRQGVSEEAITVNLNEVG